MFKRISYFIILSCLTITGYAQKGDLPLYKNSSASISSRTKDLLERMTLKEKIAQLRHLHGYQFLSGQVIDTAKMNETVSNISYGCVEGFTLTGPNCKRAMYVIQKHMIEKTRLGIPVLTVTESLHGSVQDGSTIFPQSVAIGSTFNTDLSHRMAKIIAKELKAQGINQTLTPGLDVVRDLRWGRVEESFSEDPWLVGKMGIAQVQGYLENGISPMLKPFGAHGTPLGGLNLASVECGERDLRDIYLKPFEMVIKSTGVMAVMSAYNSWNRIPNSSSYFLLTDVLRKEFGFKGFVYSDWGAVSMLRKFHHVAEDDAEAARQALMAGLDLEVGNCYKQLEGLVQQKKMDIKYINLAVERVLTTKFQLGLFENPLPDTINYEQKVHTIEAVNLSREIADEAIVLLKNDRQLLPLDITKISSIAVIGPNADQVQFGDYTWSRDNKDGITPLQGIKRLLDKQVKVNYAKGCDLISDNRSGLKEAVDAARKSEVSVVFVGSASASLARDYKNATSGEGFDLSNLDLTGVQEELIKAIHAIGKPVIVVLVTGKPFTIPWLKQNIPSIVVQWYGGERSGDAIADMLFGKTNPSAKLPFSFPQSVGHLPVYYNYLPTDKGFYHQPGSLEKPGRDYVFSAPIPLWSFGYGLSYTSFKYLNAELSGNRFKSTDTLKVKVRVYNSGLKDGKEVVQLYVRDLVSSVVTPVKQLKSFAKPFIKSGDTAMVELQVPISELALYNINMNREVEPGDFEIQIGSASDSIHISKVITVLDPQQVAEKKTSLNKEEVDEDVKEVSKKVVTISGDISDIQAAPLANVIVKSMRLGKVALTNENGKFTIQAFENDILSFFASGYEEMQVKVKKQKVINVRLNYSHNN